MYLPWDLRVKVGISCWMSFLLHTQEGLGREVFSRCYPSIPSRDHLFSNTHSKTQTRTSLFNQPGLKRLGFFLFSDVLEEMVGWISAALWWWKCSSSWLQMFLQLSFLSLKLSKQIKIGLAAFILIYLQTGNHVSWFCLMHSTD